MKSANILLSTIALLTGCGGAVYEVGGTSRAVGTDAVIEVDEIEGGNVEVKIDIAHLPPPERLEQGHTTYVVWFTPPDSPARKAGVLGYDADARSGLFRGTSPERQFDVRVTAERDRDVETPSEFVVVHQIVDVDE